MILRRVSPPVFWYWHPRCRGYQHTSTDIERAFSNTCSSFLRWHANQLIGCAPTALRSTAGILSLPPPQRLSLLTASCSARSHQNHMCQKKVAAAAKAQAHEKGTKRRLEQEAELKERLALGVGTPECRKQMVAEMKSSDGGLHGLDARTGQGLKLDESVRQLRQMRARLAATDAENHKRARQVPPNDPVHTADTDIFLHGEGGPSQPNDTAISTAFWCRGSCPRAHEAEKNPAQVQRWVNRAR